MQNINELVDYIEKEDELNIKEFLFKLLSKWYWFALFGFLGLCAGFIMAKRTPATFEMSSSVLINDESKSMGLDKLFDGFNLGSKTNVENHILMLQSYTLNLEALKNIGLNVSWFKKGMLKDAGLYKNHPFHIMLDKKTDNLTDVKLNITPMSKTSYLLTVNDIYFKNGEKHKVEFEEVGKFYETFSNEYFDFIILPNEDFKGEKEDNYYFIINNLDKLTKAFQKKLDVSLANKKADGIILKMTETIPERGVDYMNELIGSYLRYGLNEKNRTSANTVRFIDAQLEGITDSLKTAGEQFSNFRSERGIVDLSQEATFVVERLKELEIEKQQSIRKIEYFKNLHDYMGDVEQMQLMASPSVVGIVDAGLNAQVVKLSELYTKRSSLSLSVKEINPAYQVLNEEITSTLKSLEENIKNLHNNAEVELTNLNSQLSTIELELAGLPQTEQELINIKRSFDLNNELYTFLLQKRAEAAITMASNVPDAHILDPARIETVEQKGPKTTFNLLIGLILGLAIPFMVIVLSDYFNDTIQSKEELEKTCKLPFMAEIAHNHYPQELPVMQNPRSAIAETFRSLRINLNYMTQESGAKVVAVHSMVPGEGKTFISLNLASIIAMDNKKVLLVGCDLRKPRLHNLFNSHNDSGLSTYLNNNNTFSEIIRGTEQSNLYYINSGPIPPNPSELIGNGNFSAFINEAKEQFDYIILDNAPVTLVTDGLLTGKYSDINLMVLRQKYSHKKQTEYIKQLAERDTLSNIGIVLNDTVYEGYGKRYGSYSYRYGYGDGYYDENLPSKWKKKLFKRLKA